MTYKINTSKTSLAFITQSFFPLEPTFKKESFFIRAV